MYTKNAISVGLIIMSCSTKKYKLQQTAYILHLSCRYAENH